MFIHPPKKEETVYYATRMTPFDDSFVDLFKPDLAYDKVTTMSRFQKSSVKKCEEVLRRQGNTIWMTLEGSASRKVVLAVRSAALAFRRDAGHMTVVVNPGEK